MFIEEQGVLDVVEQVMLKLKDLRKETKDLYSNYGLTFRYRSKPDEELRRLCQAVDDTFILFEMYVESSKYKAIKRVIDNIKEE